MKMKPVFLLRLSLENLEDEGAWDTFVATTGLPIADIYDQGSLDSATLLLPAPAHPDLLDRLRALPHVTGVEPMEEEGDEYELTYSRVVLEAAMNELGDTLEGEDESSERLAEFDDRLHALLLEHHDLETKALQAEHDRLVEQLSARGGRGVSLAERIDALSLVLGARAALLEEAALQAAEAEFPGPPLLLVE